jgi:signal transduction histidine kinase
METTEVLTLSYLLMSQLIDTENSMRGYLLTGDRRFLEPYHSALRLIPAEQQRLSAFMLASGDHARASQLATQVADFLRFEAKMTSLIESGKQNEALQHFEMTEGGGRLADLRSTIEGYRKTEESRRLAATASTEAARRGVKTAVLIFVIFDLLLTGALAAFFHNAISRKVAILAGNMERFRVGEPLAAPLPAGDELNTLDQVFHEMVGQVEQRSLELDRSNRELESFSYSDSHDLRAPIRAIDGYSRMLQEDSFEQLDDAGKHYVTVIQQETRRMGTLIDELLAFSRLGRQPISTVDIDMYALAWDVVRDLERSLGKEVPQIVVQQPIPGARGDRGMVKQVLTNLMSNAAKFSKPTSYPRVDVGARQQNGDVIYFVRDNGVGFDMKYVDKIFGVFQRLHRQEDFEGTGVGLAIVQRIVQRHGGRIWAHGEPGKGATFYFTLAPSKATEVAASLDGPGAAQIPHRNELLKAGGSES